jgi:hypothetical protein
VKGAIRAAADSLLIAATIVVTVAFAYAFTHPDRTAAPEAARRLDVGAVGTVVVHRLDCPDFRRRSFHFVIGDGLLYGDGQIVETDAWRAREPAAAIADRDERRRTVTVGLVSAGHDRPTSAQSRALDALRSRLRQEFTPREIRVMEHAEAVPDGCRPLDPPRR